LRESTSSCDGAARIIQRSGTLRRHCSAALGVADVLPKPGHQFAMKA
jgi:hypothetical protein